MILHTGQEGEESIRKAGEVEGEEQETGHEGQVDLLGETVEEEGDDQVEQFLGGSSHRTVDELQHVLHHPGVLVHLQQQIQVQ